MTIKLQVILGIILFLALLVILNMVRRRALELKYVLVWIVSDILLLLVCFIPNAMTNLAKFLGIYSPVNMIFFLGFVFSMIIIFSLTVALSRLTERTRKLAQSIALEKYKIEKERDVDGEREN